MILKTKMWILTNIHHSLPNENLRGDYGIREACGSEKLLLRVLSANLEKQMLVQQWSLV